MANPTVIAFPSFADKEYRPYEMRALVQALEKRFRSIEQESATISIGGTELSLDDLDDRYAANPHTHVEGDITDLQSYLTSLASESIFDLSDVDGSPNNNDILVWSASTNSFELTPFTVTGNALDSLSDVDTTGAANGQVLTYNGSEWVPDDVSGSGSFGTQDEFMALDALGLSYSLWWGATLQRLEMYNDAAATSGGFWLNFQSAHAEPSVRIGQDGDTDFQFQTDAGQHIFNGLYLRIYDSSDADYGQFSHDGTDFNSAFTNTTDWNITGLTAIDFAGALTSITAIPESVVTAHEGAIDHDALTNFAADEHIDWTVTGAEDVHADRISETSVTQHEAALAITEAQITDLDHYTDTDANAAIDTRVDKAFVDALNVDADTLDGIDSTGFSLAAHTHALGDLSDVGTATPTDTHVLMGDGDSWESRVLVEADISDLGTYLETVQAADVDSEAATDGWVLTADGAGAAAWEAVSAGSELPADPDADAILFWDDSEVSELAWITSLPNSFIAETGVTQHEAALTITESQISDLGTYLEDVVASDVDSEAATDGWVLTADGAGAAAWEALPSGTLPADPNVDALLFWDDSDGAAEWATEIADSFLSANVPLLDAVSNSFDGDMVVDGDVTIGTDLLIFAEAALSSTGIDAVFRCTQGTLQQELRTLDGGNSSQYGFAARYSVNSGVDWTNLIYATPDEIEFTATLAEFNANVTLPDGFVLRLEEGADLSISSTDHAFQIGLTSAQNLAMDNNEIMARNNGSTATLAIQFEGGSTEFGGDVHLNNPATLNFGSSTRQMLNLYGTDYAIGVESSAVYFRVADSGRFFRWYTGAADGGSSDVMQLTGAGDLSVSGSIISNTTVSSGTSTFWVIRVNEVYGDSGTTAGDPVYTFHDDQDTGVGQSAADTLQFSTGGAYRLTLTDARADFNTLVDARFGISGSYGDNNGTGSDWGVNIWGMGDAYNGSGAGTTFSLGSYQLAWLRPTHAGVTAAGEGLYIRRNSETVGSIGHTGAVFSADVTAFSDIRVKDQIEVITDALNKVKRISGYTFNRIDIEEDRRHAGLIAQEVEKVLPEVVMTNPGDGMKNVAYGNVVALLVEAIKEQQKQIDELKGVR